MRNSMTVLVMAAVLAVTSWTQATEIGLEPGHYPTGPYAALSGPVGTGDGNGLDRLQPQHR
jgi:hypothetical protein